MKMILLEEIKVTRKKAFLSQEAFAITIGVSVASINRVMYFNVEDAWIDSAEEVKG